MVLYGTRLIGWRWVAGIGAVTGGGGGTAVVNGAGAAGVGGGPNGIGWRIGGGGAITSDTESPYFVRFNAALTMPGKMPLKVFHVSVALV